MGEVEPEIIVTDIGPLLFDMSADDFAQSFVKQVGSRMIVRDPQPSLSVYDELERT